MDPISWTFVETRAFSHYPKPSARYANWVIPLLCIALAFVFFVQNRSVVFSAGVFVLMALVYLGASGIRNLLPRELRMTLSDKAVTVESGPMRFSEPYSALLDFYIDETEPRTLFIRTKQGAAAPIPWYQATLEGRQDPAKIRTFLSEFLPESKERPT